jgi:hypothetical protein
VSVSNAPSLASAQWAFTAPAGTSISAHSYSRWFYKEDDEDWRPALTADGSVIETCSIVYPAVSCNAGVHGGQRATATFAGATALTLGVLCTAPTNSTCVNGAAGHHAVDAVLYGATVTLSDSSAPTLSNIGGPFLAGGYRRGSRSASFDASDNAGIRTGRVYIDGGIVASTTYSCDFTFAFPCTDKTGAELTVDTRTLADGTHSVQLAAVDAAGNETKSSSRSITVDNGAPALPRNLVVEGGDGWRTSNSFAVSWANPDGQVSPIAAAHYRLCAIDGSSCQAEQTVIAEDIARLDGISAPATGEWSLRVWLEDAAGNIDRDHAAAATLRYGNAPTATGPTELPASPGPTSDTTGAPVPLEDLTTTLTTPPSSQPTTVRRDLHLRLTSARLSHGRLVIRGRITARARPRFVFVVGTKSGRAVRRVVLLPARRFAVALRVRDPRGRLTARFAGDPTFRPATATLRVPS